MLSIQTCRQILGGNCELSDSNLELLRDQLYGLAEVTIASYKLSRKDEIQTQQRLTDKEREVWEERAAIIEFEAGLPRSEAESLALNDFARSKRNRR